MLRLTTNVKVLGVVDMTWRIGAARNLPGFRALLR
jgi:hypothetical protein